MTGTPQFDARLLPGIDRDALLAPTLSTHSPSWPATAPASWSTATLNARRRPRRWRRGWALARRCDAQGAGGGRAGAVTDRKFLTGMAARAW